MGCRDFPGSSAGKESTCNKGDLGSNPWVGKIPWRKAWQPTPIFLLVRISLTGKPGGLQSMSSMGSQKVGHNWTTKYSTARDYRDFPGRAKELACQCRRCETQVQALGLEDTLEEGMATYSSILAWRTSWTEEPGGLKSIGSQRAGHNWSDLSCACTCAHAHTHTHTYKRLQKSNSKFQVMSEPH